jgi:hypothetical protein
MSLDQAEIARIDAVIAALPDADGATLGQALGRLLPGLNLRLCDASDVLEAPFRSAMGADLHLLDSSSHCIRVTADPAEATALLIAARAPEPASPPQMRAGNGQTWQVWG